jgi:hypothetical protein
MKRNVFVLFAPGTGGNHLANLISTSDEFITRASLENYKNTKSKKAHFSGITNLGINDIKNLDRSKNYVLCGHFGEFYWLELNNLKNKFKNRQIVLLQPPYNSELATRVYKQYNPPLGAYYFAEQKSLYTIQVIQRLFNENDFFEISADDIFSDDTSTILDLLNIKMNLNVDSKLINEIHKVWIDKKKAND